MSEQTGVMSSPWISVVIATHRRAPLLRQAIQSVLSQAGPARELIVVSDVHDGDTLAVVGDVLRPQDVFVQRPGLIGPAESRNLGMSLARGRWIVFLDDDDQQAPAFLAQLHAALGARTGDVFYCDYATVRIDGQGIAGQPAIQRTTARQYAELDVGNFIPNSGVVVDANLARTISFDARLASHEDWDWFLALSRLAEWTHLDIVGPVIIERQDGSRNQTSRMSRSRALDYLSIYRKWPARSESLRLGRRRILNDFGIDVADEFL